MNLGNFSLSLAVKNLEASRAFYEKLGFTAGNGDGKTWLVLQNGTMKIALLQGLLERNMLTFNPGWDTNGKPLASFTDVRELQRQAEAAGLTPTEKADPAGKGPAHFMLVDPDGNPILIDQHV